MVVVEALGVALHVPLADDTRLVAVLLQYLRDEGLGGVDARTQTPLSVLVAVQARDEAGAARRRERVLDIGAREGHTLGRQTVDVGRGRQLRDGMTVCTDGLVGVVIGHDVDDVERLGLDGALRGAGGGGQCW